MKTLTSPVTTAAAASQAAWCELYDFYLPSAITTPWGSISTLRLTDLPGGFTFFTPKLSPEPVGTQGNAQVYNFWPIKRKMVKSDAKFANDKMQLLASNVTEDWAAMLAAINWYDVPVMIRKIPTSATGLTADDCAIIFTGQIDSAKITLKAIAFELSNDLAMLSMLAPSENMHAACRFQWGDDQCTMIKYKSTNYKAKTVGASSTTSQINSADFTEDTGASGTYGTDLVDALANSAITASSEGVVANAFAQICTADQATDFFDTQSSSNVPCNDLQVYFTGTTMPTGITVNQLYYVVNKSDATFQVANTLGGTPINYTTNGSALTVHAKAFQTSPSSGNLFDRNPGFSRGDAVIFRAGTMPSPLVAGTTYYAVPATANNWGVSATPNGAVIAITSTPTNLFCLSAYSWAASAVRASNTGYWKMGTAADWGTATNGFYLIPDAQAGLKNALLKPYIDFDFGSAKQPTIWRVGNRANVRIEEMTRLLQFFSSTDHTTWKFETYFEVPPVGGTMYDVLIPTAANSRYWRICVRSRWAASVYYGLLWKVSAYALSRNYWRAGRIWFDATTATVALQKLSRRVLQSYAGKCLVAPLPVAPAAGDTFKISRGCDRTFNACGERQNTENFGGFTDLPYQGVIR